MKTLQIGYTDLMGTRFNGHDLHKELLKLGIDSSNCVLKKESNDDRTWKLADFKGRWLLNGLLSLVEQRLSVNSLLYPFSWQLPFDKRFRQVDLVHYHLIHSAYFSLTSLPLLTRMKPSVWTLHDPWAITGHCVHPFECNRWQTGCGKCPNLTTQFPMRKDRSALMWKIKKLNYRASKIDIVVASKWMLNLAKQSPLLSNFRLHYIPFGIDLNVFRPTDSEEAKKRLGVFPGSLVVTFRAVPGEFKGLSFIKECLSRLQTDQPICILTFNDRGLADEFRGKYQIIDLGWVKDDDLTVTAYNATDVFLMPSMAEAFGMMAIEAMACGKPVITFEGTALPEVIFAPHGGIAVPKGDVDALKSALENLLRNPEERKRIGDNALNLAQQHYDGNTYVNRMLDLYKDVIATRKKEKDG